MPQYIPVGFAIAAPYTPEGYYRASDGKLYPSEMQPKPQPQPQFQGVRIVAGPMPNPDGSWAGPTVVAPAPVKAEDRAVNDYIAEHHRAVTLAGYSGYNPLGLPPVICVQDTAPARAPSPPPALYVGGITAAMKAEDDAARAQLVAYQTRPAQPPQYYRGQGWYNGNWN